jgi:hypothetical protein
MVRKVVKGSMIVNHPIDNVINDYEPLNFDFLNKDIIVIKKKKMMLKINCGICILMLL